MIKRPVKAVFKSVYRDTTKNATETVLNKLDANRGERYSVVIRYWRKKRDNLSVNFKCSEDARKALCNINAVEAVHHQFCKLTKTKGESRNEKSTLKLRYAGVLRASEKWIHPVQS